MTTNHRAGSESPARTLTPLFLPGSPSPEPAPRTDLDRYLDGEIRLIDADLGPRPGPVDDNNILSERGGAPPDVLVHEPDPVAAEVQQVYTIKCVSANVVGGAHGMRAEGGISTVRGGSSKSGRRNGCAWTRRAGGRTSRATRGLARTEVAQKNRARGTRTAHWELGEFYRAAGEHAAALKHYTKSREFRTTTHRILEMC